jgi:hypothetical protein
MAYLWLAFLGMCLLIAVAPRDMVKVFLTLTWVSMILAGCGSFVYELARRL